MIRSPFFILILVTAVAFSAAAQEPVKLSLGHFPNITHGQALVARQLARQGKGWFEERLEAGVQVEWFVYNTGPSAMEAILAGSIDATYVDPNAVLNAHIRATGEEIRVIGGAALGGACLDTDHTPLSGDLGRVFHKLAGHLELDHINDNMGDWDAHLVPGEGSIDWPWVITELHRQAFRGDLVLEMSARPNESMESALARARRGRDFLALLLVAHHGNESRREQPLVATHIAEGSFS